jgi:hypothetical protein
MKTILKYTLAATSLALVAACGGGGGGTGSTADNPLQKYEGTYYVCDANEKTTLQMVPTGSNGLNVTMSAEVYSADNCGGSVIGSYRWNSPALLTYTGATTANLPPVTVLPYADTLDKVTLNISSMTATLTGSGVSGSCVNYSYSTGSGTRTGNHCYDLVMNATSSNGALYKSSNGQYVVQFELNNGTYEAQMMVSSNSAFNLTSLILD